MKKLALLGLVLALGSAPAIGQKEARPPVAPKKPYAVKGPGGIERQDEYYWLRDDSRKNPEMLGYLNAENAYADAVLAPLKPLQEKLYSEFVSRIKQDDASVPFRERGYFYYSRFEKGQDYPVIARRKGSMSAREEVLLNQPALAEGKGYFQISAWEPSQDNRLLAYAEDIIGRRQYVLRVKDLASGNVLPDAIQNVESDIVWADDNKTIYYIEKDPVTLLSKRVKAHVLGTPASADWLVYEEKDESFYMSLARTTSDKYVCIILQSTVSNEQRCTSAARPGEFFVLAPREREFRYTADHIGGQWMIRTNWNAPNYKLMRVVDANARSGRAKWADFIAHSPDVFIEDFKPFDRFTAIEERSGGNKRLRLLPNGAKSSFLASDEPAYAMALDVNPEPGTDWCATATIR